MTTSAQQRRSPLGLFPDKPAPRLYDSVAEVLHVRHYGGGLRLLKALRLRVKDLDFERGEITVREGKGDKDRVTTIRQEPDASVRLDRIPPGWRDVSGRSKLPIGRVGRGNRGNR